MIGTSLNILTCFHAAGGYMRGMLILTTWKILYASEKCAATWQRTARPLARPLIKQKHTLLQRNVGYRLLKDSSHRVAH